MSHPLLSSMLVVLAMLANTNPVSYARARCSDTSREMEVSWIHGIVPSTLPPPGIGDTPVAQAPMIVDEGSVAPWAPLITESLAVLGFPRFKLRFRPRNRKAPPAKPSDSPTPSQAPAAKPAPAKAPAAQPASGGAARTAPTAQQAGPPLSKQAQKSIHSLEQRLAEHRNKLAAFRGNPDAFDNKGFLRNAPSQEARERIIQGRIKHLEQEIRNFEQQIERLRRGGKH